MIYAYIFCLPVTNVKRVIQLKKGNETKTSVIFQVTNGVDYKSTWKKKDRQHKHKLQGWSKD